MLQVPLFDYITITSFKSYSILSNTIIFMQIILIMDSMKTLGEHIVKGKNVCESMSLELGFLFLVIFKYASQKS